MRLYNRDCYRDVYNDALVINGLTTLLIFIIWTGHVIYIQNNILWIITHSYKFSMFCNIFNIISIVLHSVATLLMTKGFDQSSLLLMLC